MADLFLLNRNRVLEFLRARGPASTRDVADHFDWTLRSTVERLKEMAQHRLIQIEKSLASSEEHRLWSAVD